MYQERDIARVAGTSGFHVKTLARGTDGKISVFSILLEGKKSGRS